MPDSHALDSWRVGEASPPPDAGPRRIGRSPASRGVAWWITKRRGADLEASASESKSVAGGSAGHPTRHRKFLSEMNWANQLNSELPVLTVLFACPLISRRVCPEPLRFCSFWVAGITDLSMAKCGPGVTGIITTLGKLMDPLVDKIMMASAFISLVPLKAALVGGDATVVARDFLITGLRSDGHGERTRAPPRNWKNTKRRGRSSR